MKFIVAGAGLAGLNAAWELTKAGHTVEVFESNNRVGGRCWSEVLSNGEVIEHGGEFIDVNDHTIRRLCAEFGLPIVSLGIMFDRRWQVDGTIMSPAELAENIRKLTEAAERLAETRGYRVSLREVAREAYGSDYADLPYCQKLFATTTCDPDKINGIAVARMFQGHSQDYIEHRGRVMAGNDAVAREIHRRIGDIVRFDTPIVGVTQDDVGVQFTSATGDVYHGDRAVIAVPLPKLKMLIGTLDLPPLMRTAIDGRVMGAAAKLNVVVSGETPPRGMQAPNAPWWSWSTESKQGYLARGALTVYAGGKATMDSLHLEDGGSYWLQQTRNYRTDLDVSDDYILTNWETNPHTQGAYSMPGLDWHPEQDGIFNQATGKIAFAGEHTHFASLNGALESGARAAKLLTLI
ncbi:flavin monoamine oxidase family protein [Pararhizobium sp. O133]|uniref:flavin monoamine oxidase family protein n=1 Tax=Pararhizobium sp. O133 TaxID=3449278 RepID=UPI003F6868B8